ncbi:phage tail domain-containing protein [Staphylococcus haemolyticus]|uniref:phage tail domain-containing protein n=1 Tax=Staphylococcus haemolyticus TaxID=1283 RepID=UPI002596A4E6|nr:phage tail domain-containing protein [Staphylococcus haemolyticus]MDM3980636.1 phage tail family protein [Staphylococcus haemolyticus]
MITLTFTLYDENINEIKYPVGVTPLDILVSSIERERYEENIKGIPGPIDYGFDFKEREITLKFQMEHYHDTFDFRLQRDELYNIFNSHNHLYVSDNLVPTRVIKLQVDGQFTPERYGYWYSTLEITGKTTGLPFWRTKYTTQDVEALGFDAVSEKFGMADGLNIDYPKYTFTENKFIVWNGGNVTLDPRNMPLKIKLKHLLTDGNFKLTNKTTGETFEYYAPRTGNTVDLDGVQAFVGYQLNRLRETNRKYISIVPGINEIEYSGGTMDDIQFDFPFYFK